jgi:hypothetical protein
MQTEGTGHLKISEDPTGFQTQYLSPCGTVLQPIVPPLTPQRFIMPTNFQLKHLSVECKDELE